MVKGRAKPSRRAATEKASRTAAVQKLIPAHLNLLGKKWKVTTKGDGKNFGTCSHTSCTINVNPTHAIDQLRDTLLHEVIHALEVEGQLRMNERQVTGIATLLFSALRQNPDLVRFILG